MRSMSNKSSRRSNRKSEGKAETLILVTGLGIFLIGSIGLFFGRLIKSGVSRQRELLADAHAVQYTRHPQGLVNALRRIQQREEKSYLQSQFVEDISHLCFSSSRELWLRNLLATHPPIEKRIALLDPQGLYLQQALEQPYANQATTQSVVVKKEASSLNIIPAMATAQLQGAQLVAANTLQDTIGKPTPFHFEYAKQLMTLLSPALQQVAHEPDSVENIFYALMVEKDIADEVTTILTAEHASVDFKMLAQLHQAIQALPVAAKLPLLELGLPAFKTLSLSKREAVFQTMDRLARLGKYRLFEMVLLALIGKTTVQRNTQAPGQYPSFQPVLTEVSVLIAFILMCGQHSPDKKITLYGKMMSSFTSQNVPLPKKEDIEPTTLFNALTKLNLLYPLHKEKLLKACIACIEEDNQITLAEAEMIRTVAACLDSPIPPIIPTKSQ